MKKQIEHKIEEILKKCVIDDEKDVARLELQILVVMAEKKQLLEDFNPKKNEG